MPSNKELIEEATVLAEELELEIQTKGLKNQDLAALVSDLKAKARDADNETQADVAETDVGVATPSPRAIGRYVAEGKAITSKKGILSEGTTVTVDMLQGGQEALSALIDREFVVTR